MEGVGFASPIFSATYISVDVRTPTASERKENTVKGSKEFYRKAKTRIWLGLNLCAIFARQGQGSGVCLAHLLGNKHLRGEDQLLLAEQLQCAPVLRFGV